ncbi:MAG TPA: hypothetical protein VMT22_24400, partial [Terriglobales bacterium]|nr:hypothetical protein [Terriglobales bacterium]
GKRRLISRPLFLDGKKFPKSLNFNIFFKPSETIAAILANKTAQRNTDRRLGAAAPQQRPAAPNDTALNWRGILAISCTIQLGGIFLP